MDSLNPRNALLPQSLNKSFLLEIHLITKYDSLFSNPSVSYYPELPFYRIMTGALTGGDAISSAKGEFLKMSGDYYRRTKPSAFQNFLGMVEFAGAVGLAGYHVYKYNIKKDEAKKEKK